MGNKDHTIPDTLVIDRRTERGEQRRSTFEATNSLDDFAVQIDQVVPEAGLMNTRGTRTYTKSEIRAMVDHFTQTARTFLKDINPGQLSKGRDSFRRHLLTDLDQGAGITSAAQLRETLVDTAINERLASKIPRSSDIPETKVMRVPDRRPRTEQPFAQARTITEVVIAVKQLYAGGEAINGADGQPLTQDHVTRVIIAAVNTVENNYKIAAQDGGQLTEPQILQLLAGEVDTQGRMRRPSLPEDRDLRRHVTRIINDTYRASPLPSGVVLNRQRVQAEKVHRQNLAVVGDKSISVTEPAQRGQENRPLVEQSLQRPISSPEITAVTPEPPTASEISRETLVAFQKSFNRFVREFERLHARHVPEGKTIGTESIWPATEAFQIAYDLRDQLTTAFSPMILDLQSRYPGQRIEIEPQTFTLTVQDQLTTTRVRVGNAVSSVISFFSENLGRQSQAVMNAQPKPRRVEYMVTFEQDHFEVSPI